MNIKALLTLARVFVVGVFVAGAASASPVQNTIRELSPMNSPRAGHTATALKDGRVLIVGGFMGDESEIAGVELFDAETFRSIPNLGTPRQSHTATLLPDGRVLIAGGYGSNVGTLDSAEIFDPKTQKFAAAGAMKSRRAEHIALLLGDGRVALIGGIGSEWTYLGSIEVFDPKTGAFTEVGQMTVPRGMVTAELLRDGRIFIAGGQPGRGAEAKRYKSTEIFDLRTGTSTLAAELALTHSDAVLLADGRVLLAGGADERGIRGKYDSAEIYDPVRNTVTATAKMNKGRYKQRGSSLLLPNGKVLLAGGAPKAELYDPATDSFQLIESALPLHGSFSAVTLLGNHRVLITGGYYSPVAPSKQAWIYTF